MAQGSSRLAAGAETIRRASCRSFELIRKPRPVGRLRY